MRVDYDAPHHDAPTASPLTEPAMITSTAALPGRLFRDRFVASNLATCRAETGVVSAEDELNVLGRLTSAATPEPVDTALQLGEAPRADTGRYDSLRAEQAAVQEVDHDA